MRPRGFSSHPLIGLALTLGLLLGGAGHETLWAAQPKASIRGPASIPAGATLLLDGRGAVSDKPIEWRLKGPDLILIPLDSGGRQGVFAVALNCPRGVYRIIQVVKGKPDGATDLDVDVDVLDVTVGDPGPIPTPTPVPPGPTPTPTPVPPAPTPAPIPATGLHVLMVYDSLGLSKMPVPQVSVLYAKAIRDYLNAKCPAGQDGKTKEWRIWDAKVDASADEKLWQDALARPRASVPWIVISDPAVGGYEGPLPATVDDTLALLKKYGGN